jgi:hypothetical protein
MKGGKHMFSSIFINPYPIYNSMEVSKVYFSNGAKGGEPSLVLELILSYERILLHRLANYFQCVCVFFSLFLLLSL